MLRSIQGWSWGRGRNDICSLIWRGIRLFLDYCFLKVLIHLLCLLEGKYWNQAFSCVLLVLWRLKRWMLWNFQLFNQNVILWQQIQTYRQIIQWSYRMETILWMQGSHHYHIKSHQKNKWKCFQAEATVSWLLDNINELYLQKSVIWFYTMWLW